MPEKGVGSASDVLEVVRYYQQEYQYRNDKLWALIYSTIASVIGLMAIPYFTHNSFKSTHVLVIFPILAGLLALFSAILLKFESVRMRAAQIKSDELLKTLSQSYTRISIKSISQFVRIFDISMTTLILVLYFILIVLVGIEVYLIYSVPLFL